METTFSSPLALSPIGQICGWNGEHELYRNNIETAPVGRAGVRGATTAPSEV